jgi:hypothetical protein
MRILQLLAMCGRQPEVVLRATSNLQLQRCLQTDVMTMDARSMPWFVAKMLQCFTSNGRVYTCQAGTTLWSW